jgi:signal transduction histidine kinase
VLSSAAPVRNPSGHVTGAVTIHHEITALKELERMREEWTSVIAHDLRQPVAAITAYAGALSALAEQQPSLEPFGRRADNIAAAAGQLERMIADLLDVSRLGAGQLKLEPTSIDLPLLLRGVFDRAAAATRGHPTEVRIQEQLPRAWADPGRLEQVLVNLLSNAAKYGYTDTPITLAVELQHGEVQIAVTNEGAGIPPEEIPRLFSRFYRTGGARAGGAPGLGLGLYVCRELVRAHGGRIWVESTPGATTTFRFTLPVASA